MYDDITKLFDQLLDQSGSIDIAESEFKRLVAEDAELRDCYRQWCDEMGTSEKNGFIDYCDDLRDERDSVWDSLSDYDE